MNTAVIKNTGVANIANNLAVKLGMGEVGAELVASLKQTAFKGEVSDGQFTALMVVANQYGLNPWTREIYAFPDKNNGIVPVVGVDGWSRIINEHPQFDGVEFEMPEDGSQCTCIIYRKDRGRPIKVTEYLVECKRDGFGPWKTHPKRMLRHKAMIQCARLAFGYTGIFDEDEAQRIVEKDVTQHGTHENKAPAIVYYSDEEFNAKASGWEQVVKDGRKTPDTLIATVESKGKKFTDAQKALIAEFAKQPEPIEGELLPAVDPFVAEMEAAEQSQGE